MHMPELKKSYSFSDCLFWVAMALVPVMVAGGAVAAESGLWAAIYVLILLAVNLGIVVRLFCTRCPHYRKEGKVHCLFMWAMPRIYPARQGGLTSLDKLILAAGGILMVLFPLPWLLLHPWSLIIYLLSASLFAAGLRRFECCRCIYFGCPLNTVPGQVKQADEDHDGGMQQ